MGKQIELITSDSFVHTGEPGNVDSPVVGRVTDQISKSHKKSSDRIRYPQSYGLAFFVFGFALTLAGIFVFGVNNPKRVPILSLSAVSAEFSTLLYQRDVHLAENLQPFAEVIRQQLPWAHSNFYWNMYPSEIQRSLESVPILEYPVVRRCTSFSWKCFHLNASVRKPQMYARLDNDWWLIDKEGRFLSPVGSAELESFPQITGLTSYKNNPELLREATAQVARTVYWLQRDVGRAVISVKLSSSDAMHVSFAGFSAPFVLDPSELSRAQLQKVAAKVRSILTLQEVNVQPVKAVDLRYRGMAVVKQLPTKPQ